MVDLTNLSNVHYEAYWWEGPGCKARNLVYFVASILASFITLHIFVLILFIGLSIRPYSPGCPHARRSGIAVNIETASLFMWPIETKIRCKLWFDRGFMRDTCFPLVKLSHGWTIVMRIASFRNAENCVQRSNLGCATRQSHQISHTLPVCLWCANRGVLGGDLSSGSSHVLCFFLRRRLN